MDRTDLASDVVETLEADSEASVSVEEVLLDLHHSSIPMLVDAGIVSYDDCAQTVAYEGHPDLDRRHPVVGGDDTPRGVQSAADQ